MKITLSFLCLISCAQVLAAPPSAPATLTHSVYSDTAAELFWDRATDDGFVVAYEVYRDGELLRVLDATSFFDDTLLAGSPYQYQVVAVDNDGDRSEALQTIITTGSTAVTDTTGTSPLSAPAGLRVAIYSATAAEIFWERSTDDTPVVGYEISRNGSVLEVRDSLGFFDPGLDPGISYEFSIVKVGIDGSRSAASSIVFSTDGSTIPDDGDEPSDSDPMQSVVSGLKADRYSSTAIELFWDRSRQGGITYRVLRDGILVAMTAGISYFDDSLVSGQSYRYSVASVDSAGMQSDAIDLLVGPDTINPSPPVNTPTELASPIGLDVAVYSDTAAEIFWDRPTVSGIRYEVFRDGNLLANTDGTGYFEGDLSAGQRYQYEVVAIDSNGRRSTGSVINVQMPGDSNDVDTETPVVDPPVTDPAISPALIHIAVISPKGSATPQNSNLFSSTGPQVAANLAEPLAVLFEVVENNGPNTGIDCKPLEAHFAACSVVNLHLKDSNATLNDGNWKLYFHSVRRILQTNSSEFDVFVVNGDLHYLTPSAGFQGFTNSSVKTLGLVTEYNFIHETDVMPRYWLVRDGQTPLVVPNTDTSGNLHSYVVPVTGSNRKLENADNNPVADSANRFDRHADSTELASVADLIVPTPRSVSTGTATRTIGGALAIDSNVLSSDSVAALNTRLASFHNGGGASMPVTTSLSSQFATNEYRLIVDAGGASISGGSNEAVFHGAQSLLALVTPGVNTVPHIDVSDSPRFEYRGMHVDVARHFQSVASLKSMIDQMAAYKLNRLHLHLSDDEGWRLEIPSLPELTSIGATRKFQLDSNGNPIETAGLLPQLGTGPGTANQGTGFFSRAEFVDLLRYANARFVQVIPSMDMPAHARAAVVSMRVRAANLGAATDTNIRLDDPVDASRYLTIQHYDDNIMNPCIEGTYNFFQSVVTDVNAMYGEAGAPLDVWHMGGDEANSIFKSSGFQDVNDANKVFWKGDVDQSQQDHPWERSPACQQLIAADASLSNLEDLNRRFITRVSEIVANAGIESLYGWHDIAFDVSPAELATSKAGVTYWESINVNDGGNNAYAYANSGFETVLSVPDYLYFDFAQEADPAERGQYWGARYIDTRKVFSFAPENLPQNAETGLTKLGNPFSSTGNQPAVGFKGMQGQLWSELISQSEFFDYMAYPRLLALAERAWHKGSWERDYATGTTYSNSSNLVDTAAMNTAWNRFANALGGKELAKLESAGVDYRLPTVGAKLSASGVEMNSPFPGLGIEYSVDGTTWQTYSNAAPPASASLVRSRSTDGQRTGRETPNP